MQDLAQWARFASGVVVFGLLAHCHGAPLRLVADTVVDQRATTIAGDAPYGRAINGEAFQGQALTSFNGYEYAIYWVTDAATAPAAHVAVARRKLPDGAWQVADLAASIFKNGVRKGTHEPFDAHNTCSIGICPADGTIHVAYDHHNNPLRYRASVLGAAARPASMRWDESLFAVERDELVAGQPISAVCYPYFERTPAGNLQLFVRRGGSGDGSWWVWNYDGAKHAWVDGWQYDDGRAGAYDQYAKPSPRRSSYPNAWTYGPDGKLHSVFVWREAGQSPGAVNHDVSYIYSEDNGVTWKNNAGQVVGDHHRGLLVGLLSPGLVVVPTTAYESLMNTQAQAVDSAGRIHSVMYHLDPTKHQPTPVGRSWQLINCSYFHHWRDESGVWHVTALPASVGSRPQMAFDRDDNAYVVFTNGKSQGIYATDRDLVIASASAASKWSDWTIVATVKGPFHSEPLIDQARMRAEGILSIVIQQSPTRDLQPTPLHVLDFAMGPQP
ncbi:MAG: BNR repeat-containing protein [Tepidisphaeraceae bacterium]